MIAGFARSMLDGNSRESGSNYARVPIIVGAREITLHFVVIATMVESLLSKLRSGGKSSIQQELKGKGFYISPKLHGIEAESRLIEAVKNSDVSIVRKYFRFGLSPNLRNDYNRPLFFLCCRIGNLNVVSEFLNHGVNINEATFDGQTALHVAVNTKSLDVIKVLLLSGASLTAKTRAGLKPIDIADYKSEIWKILKNAEDGILPEEVKSYKIPELEKWPVVTPDKTLKKRTNKKKKEK